MQPKIGDKIFIKTGTIVSQTDYPHLGLTYYCVKVWEPWGRCFDLIYIEKSQLEKLMTLSPESDSDTHIQNYKDANAK